MAALRISALVLVAAGCGDLQGFGGPAPPLATIQLEVTGDVPTDPAPIKLQIALVYGTQWLTEPLCILPPPSPEVQTVVDAGCRDTFGFVPDRVGAVVDVVPGVPTTLELDTLPGADVMVGDVTSRVAYASFVVFDDRNTNDTLDFSRPSNQPSGGPGPGPGPLSGKADIVYGASFFSMTAPDQRLAFREGGFNTGAAFYPRSGCGDPLPGFSIVGAGGFSKETALVALAAGKLPPEDPAACSEQLLDATVVTIPITKANQLIEVACDERRTDSSVRYREPPSDSEPPHLEGHPFACTTIPDFGNDTHAPQLVVASRPEDRCQGLVHYVLSGCDNDPLCAVPEWDYRNAPPAWWPCPAGAAR
jgi:hypothetical protein